MKEITPTQKYYNTFRLYAPDKRCKECGQIVKSKRPNIKFYLLGITKSGLLRIKKSNTKTVNNYHSDFFIIEPPKTNNDNLIKDY